MQTLAALNTYSAANTTPTVANVEISTNEGANILLVTPTFYPIHDFGNTLVGNGIQVVHVLHAPDSACYLEWPTPQFPQHQGNGNGNVTINTVSSGNGQIQITITGIRTAEDYFEADTYLDFPGDYFGSGATGIGYGQGNITSNVSQPSTNFYMVYGQHITLENRDEWSNVTPAPFGFDFFGTDIYNANNVGGGNAYVSIETSVAANAIPQITDFENPDDTIYTLTVTTQDIAGRFQLTGNTAANVAASWGYEADNDRDGRLTVVGTRDEVNSYVRGLRVLASGGDATYPLTYTAAGAAIAGHPLTQKLIGNLRQFQYIGANPGLTPNLNGGFALITDDVPYANAGNNHTVRFGMDSTDEVDLGLVPLGGTLSGYNNFLAPRTFYAYGQNFGPIDSSWSFTSVGLAGEPFAVWENSWCHEAWIQNNSTWDATIYYYQGLPWSIVDNQLWIGGLIKSGTGGQSPGWNTALVETQGDRLPNECGYSDDPSTYTERIVHNEPLVPGQWYHVAVERDQGVLRVYVDGRENSTYYSSGMTTTTAAATVNWNTGYRANALQTYMQWGGIGVLWSRLEGSTARVYRRRSWRGKLHDIRISQGARYGGEFQPPTQPMVNDQLTWFLGNFRNAVVVDDYTLPNLDSGVRQLTWNFTSPYNPTANNAITGNYYVNTHDQLRYGNVVLKYNSETANVSYNQAQRTQITLGGVDSAGNPVYLAHIADNSGQMRLQSVSQNLVSGTSSARSQTITDTGDNMAAPTGIAIAQLSSQYDTANVGVVPQGNTRIIGAAIPRTGQVTGGDAGLLTIRLYDFEYDPIKDQIVPDSWNDFNGLPVNVNYSNVAGSPAVSIYNIGNGYVQGPLETHVASTLFNNVPGYWSYNVSRGWDNISNQGAGPVREYDFVANQGSNVVYLPGATQFRTANVPHSSLSVVGIADNSRHTRIMFGAPGYVNANAEALTIRMNRRTVLTSQSTDNQIEIASGLSPLVNPYGVVRTSLGVANATVGNTWLVAAATLRSRQGNTTSQTESTGIYSINARSAANVLTQPGRTIVASDETWHSGRIGAHDIVSGNNCAYLVWTVATTNNYLSATPWLGTNTGNSTGVFGRSISVNTANGAMTYGAPFAIITPTDQNQLGNELSAASYVHAGNTYITVATRSSNTQAQFAGIRVPDAGFAAGTALDLQGNYLSAVNVGEMAPDSGYLRFACLFYYVPPVSGNQGVVSFRLGVSGDWGFVFNVENNRPRLIRIRNVGSDAGTVTTSGTAAGDYLTANSWNLVVGYLNNLAPDLSTTLLYINGSSRAITSSGTYPNQTIDFGWSTTNKTITVGRNDPNMIGGATALTNTRMAYVWADAGTTAPDITKFWNAGPRWLGTTGTATGLPEPLIYFQGNENTFPVSIGAGYRLIGYGPVLGASGPTYV